MNKTAIVLHHSAIQGENQFIKINEAHNRRWPGHGIAYHYLIEATGEVKQGRAEESIGYHAGKWWMNVRSIGICVAGHLTLYPPSEEQVRSLAALVTDIQKRRGIPNSEVYLHREIKPTACPGTDLRGLIAEEHERCLKNDLKAKENALRWASGRRKNYLTRAIDRMRRLLGMV